MLDIEIAAVGRLKSGPFHDLYADYAARLKGWRLSLHEIDERKPADASLLDRMKAAEFSFVLDERGAPLASTAFADRLATLENGGTRRVCFAIGGAGGHGQAVRARADFLLSFGIQTWPHMLARVMLAEQIYRARQILDGHPYHKA